MELGHTQGNTYDKFKEQKLMDPGPGQQNDHETKRQKEREKNLPDSDSDISEQQSNIGNMANTFLESALETEYVQNLTDSMQNLFPRNFQNLTGTVFRDDDSPQKSQNPRSSLSSSRTSGSALCAQNEQNDFSQEDISPTRSNDSACKNSRNQKSESDSVNPSNCEIFENIRRPTFRRNLLSQGQRDGSLSPGSQRFSPHDQYIYVQTPASGRVLHRQEQCDDTLGPGSHNFLSPHEQWRDSKSPGSWSYNNCGIGESMQSHQQVTFLCYIKGRALPSLPSGYGLNSFTSNHLSLTTVCEKTFQRNVGGSTPLPVFACNNAWKGKQGLRE
jgi:hypothetical protein